MAGRRSKKLSREYIRRLSDFRIARRISFPILKSTMDAPFKWQVLKSALDGNPIWEMNHYFIVRWIDRFLPADSVPTFDGKAASAGEREV